MRRFLLVAVGLALVSTVAFALEGEPVADTDVKLGRKLRGDGIVVAQGTTDSQGSITFKKLKAGAYFVWFMYTERAYQISAKPDGEEIRISKAAAKKGSSKDSKILRSFPWFLAFSSGLPTVSCEVVMSGAHAKSIKTHSNG